MKTKVLSNKDKSGLGTYNSKGKVFPITYFEKTFDGFVQKCVLHNIPYESLIIKALTSDD